MENKWVIFDAMGVIFEIGEDVDELLIPFMRKRKNISTEDIQNIYKEASLGNISSKKFWEMAGFGENYPAIEREYLDNCLTLDPQFVTVAEKLKERFHLAFLSNDISEWSSYLRLKHNLNRLFSVTVVSGDVHIRKPDPAIFRCLLSKIQAKPQDCAFIDDNPNNLNTAADIGFTTIRFIREKIRNQLKAEKVINSLEELPDILCSIK